jgi:hypothetical protein
MLAVFEDVVEELETAAGEQRVGYFERRSLLFDTYKSTAVFTAASCKARNL